MMRLMSAKLRRPLTTDAAGSGEVMEVLQLKAAPAGPSRHISPRSAMQGTLDRAPVCCSALRCNQVQCNAIQPRLMSFILLRSGSSNACTEDQAGTMPSAAVD